jgi:hypothetical protein
VLHNTGSHKSGRALWNGRGARYLLIIADKLDLTQKINEGVEKAVDLTEFSLQEGKVHDEVYDYPHPTDVNPFANNTPKDIVEREYQMGTGFTIVAPSTIATQYTFNFLDVMETQNNLAMRSIAGFQFIRWKSIEWRILVNASPFIYGMIFATCVPVDQRRGDVTNDFGLLSHDDCVLIDVTSMPEVTISQPWMFPTEWLDRGVTQTDASVAPFVTLTLGQMNSIFQQDPSGPTSIEIQIYARWSGVEVSGFCDPASGPVPRHEAQAATMLGVAGVGAGGVLASAAIEGAIGMATSYVAGKIRGTEEADTTKENASDVIPNVFGGMVFSPQKNMLGDGSQVLPYAAATHSIMDFIKKPSLVQVNTFTSSSLGVKGFSGYGTPFSGIEPVASCSRIAFMGQFFRRWRGSLNYTFVFFSSPFTSWRIQIRLAYDTTGSSFRIGDQAVKTITVRGSNHTTVTVPWNYPFTWDACGADNNTSSVNVSTYMTNSPINLAQVSGVTPASLFMMVYESAGDDFQFCSQREPGTDRTPAGTHEAQMRVCDFCKHDSFGTAGDNISHGAQTSLTFETMARRWSGRSSGSFTSTRPAYYDAPTKLGVGTFDAISSIFLYYRGQQKFKLFIVQDQPDESLENTMLIASLSSEKTTTMAGLPGAWRACDGLAAISLALTNVLEYTVPYISYVDWQPVGTPATPYQAPGFQQTQVDLLVYDQDHPDSPLNPTLDGVYVSAGSDFAYSYILPPPYYLNRWYLFTPSPSKQKQNGINTLRAKLTPNLKGRITKVNVPRLISDALLKDVAACSEGHNSQGVSNKNRSQKTRLYDETTSISESI